MAALKRPGTRVWMWVFVALLLGHAVVILASPNPPVLQDYPDWVYQGVLFAKLLARHPVPGYMLKHYPVPNSLTTVGVALLTMLLGWQAAAKVWLVLVLAALGGGCVRLVWRLGGRNGAVLPIFACSVVTGLDLWNGSINFQLSLALLLVLLAHLLGPAPRPWKTAALLLLCFFTHMLPCGAGLLALAALALQQRDWRPLLPAVPTLLLAAWYALARDPAESQQSPLHLVPALAAVLVVLWWTERGPALQERSAGGSAASVLILLPSLPAFAVIAASKLLILCAWIGPLNVLTSGTGPDRVLWPVALFSTFSAVGLCAAALGWWTLGSSWRSLLRAKDPRRLLAVTAVALAALFLLSPPDALGVTGIDSRFLHLAIASGLGLLSLRPSRPVTVLAVLATVVAVFNLGQFAAVQMHPLTISVPPEHALQWASPVAPALRFPYYASVQTGTYNRWIFPTALFRWLPR